MKNIKLFLFLILVFVKFNNVSAQKRADSYYNNLQYAKAIPLYKKAVGKKHGAKAIEKLAHSYRLINNYELAAHYYALLITNSDVNPVNYLHYGEVLMNLNNYHAAVINLEKYNQKIPEDKKGILLLKAAKGIDKLIDQTPLFVVKNLEEINSKFSDYAPFIHEKGLIFVSEREKDYVENLKDGYSNSPYSTVLISRFNTKKENRGFKNPRNFSHRINSDFQNGPLTFNANQDFMVFNKTDKEKKGKEFVNRPKLYTAQLIKGKWSNIKEFPYNNNDYSLGHPALSPDGKYLYFSSNMPGGYGGNDLYVSENTKKGWSKPKNLGAVINTPLNESFPYVSNIGNFYFASDGHPGYGGYDIFTAKGALTEWKDVFNISAPLNSSYDDISIVFNADESEGYFSSNRTEGSGSDDIYHFRNAKHWNTIDGKLFLSENAEDPGANVKMVLLSNEGTVLQTTTTENNGSFSFRYLPPDEKFMVKIEEKDTRFTYGKKVFLSDENNNVVKKTTVDEGEEFTFYNLPFDPYKTGDKVIDDSRINLTGSVVAGDNPKIPLSNQKISIINKNGEEIYTGITDEKGNYMFKNIPPYTELSFFLTETDKKLNPNTKITIADKNGNPIKVFYTNSNGKFNYKLIPADYFTLNQLEEKDLLIKSVLKGKIFSNEKTKAPVQDLNISLVDNKGEVHVKSKTDPKGAFVFDRVNALGDYIINLDDKDLHLRFKELFIADNYGNIVRKITFQNGNYSFEMLPSYAFVLKKIQEPDNLEMKGKIFSDKNGTPAAHTKVNLLNENKQVMQTVQTDEQGNFNFVNLPPDHNYIVSVDQNDTKLNTKQLFLADANGKIINEIMANQGRFNFEILPSFSSALFTLKEDDTVFKIELSGIIVSDKDSKKPIKDLIVLLMNSKGKSIQKTNTNESGAFKFSKLDPHENYVIDIDQNNQKITNQTIYLLDKQGNMVKVLFSGTKKFNFQLLPSDLAKLGRVEEFNTALRIEFKGKIYQDEKLKTPASGIKVDLIDEQGQIVEFTLSDIDGAFKFTNLPPDNNYMVNVDMSTDTKFKFTSLYLTDNKGNLIKTAKAEKGSFTFTFLPTEYNTLTTVSIEDTWVKIKDLKDNKTDKVIKIEYVQYNFDSHEILPEAAKILDKAVRAMEDNQDMMLEINGHTDSRGTSEYNQKLSERRANSAKNHIVSKGINPSRIITIGHGEKKLLNHCSDDVICPDNLHKINQRTEFEVSLKKQ
ncbi:MAG: OmpA family protein [Bacteroidota bacterium]|nr:OmpA family protein [Bacteroidota bacterium]